MVTIHIKLPPITQCKLKWSLKQSYVIIFLSPGVVDLVALRLFGGGLEAADLRRAFATFLNLEAVASRFGSLSPFDLPQIALAPSCSVHTFGFRFAPRTRCGFGSSIVMPKDTSSRLVAPSPPFPFVSSKK